MATIALPLPPSAPVCPPSPSAVAERNIAAAISRHRDARRQILARAQIAADHTVARQLEDALTDLRRLETEFAKFRQKSEARIQVARAENTRLANALAEARQVHSPSNNNASAININNNTGHCELLPSAKQNNIDNGGSNSSNIIPARRRDQYVESTIPTTTKKKSDPSKQEEFKKPFEDELSVSRLESSVKNTTTTTASPGIPRNSSSSRRMRAIRASGTPISFEHRWKHRMPMSRSRSAHTVGRAKFSHEYQHQYRAADNSNNNSNETAIPHQRRRRSTAGLFKRSSFSFSRSNRPSSDRSSRPSSARWNSCF